MRAPDQAVSFAQGEHLSGQVMDVAADHCPSDLVGVGVTNNSEIRGCVCPRPGWGILLARTPQDPARHDRTTDQEAFDRLSKGHHAPYSYRSINWGS